MHALEACRSGEVGTGEGCHCRGIFGLMSVSVYRLVLSKKVGSAKAKAILSRMAWAAHDNGTNCYLSKVRMIAETEMSKSTLYVVIGKLEESGLVVRSGMVGECVNYSLNLAAIESLPMAHSRPTAPSDNNGYAVETEKASAPDSFESRRVQPSDGKGPVAGPKRSGSRTQITNNKKNDSGSHEESFVTSRDDRKTTDPEFKYLVMIAERLRSDAYVASSAVTTAQAGRMLHLNLVDKEVLRKSGIAY